MTAPETKPRTWRPIALWSAGILAALALAWLVASVVVPVWQVRKAIANGHLASNPALEQLDAGREGTVICEFYALFRSDKWDNAVRELGGGEAALRKLRVYINAPRLIAPDKVAAIRIALSCDMPESALPVLRDAVHCHDSRARITTSFALWLIANGNGAPEAVHAMEPLLKDRDRDVRAAAVSALQLWLPMTGTTSDGVSLGIRATSASGVSLQKEAAAMLDRNQVDDLRVMDVLRRTEHGFVKSGRLLDSLEPDDAVAVLGAGQKAARRLAGYLRTHHSHQNREGVETMITTNLLGECGPAGEEQLRTLLTTGDAPCRKEAAIALRRQRERCKETLEALRLAKENDQDEAVRSAAAETLDAFDNREKTHGEEPQK